MKSGWRTCAVRSSAAGRSSGARSAQPRAACCSAPAVVRPGRGRGPRRAPGRSRAGSSSTAGTCRSATIPSREMWVGGQLFNLNTYNAVPPRSVRVWLDYGTGPLLRPCGRGGDPRAADPRPGLGRQAGRAEGVADAQRRPVLRARAHVRPAPRHRVPLPVPVRLRPRDRRDRRRDVHDRARRGLEPFTFTAFGDEGIPGPSLDRDPSLLPESDWGMWNNGSFDSGDPDNPARTKVNTTTP